MSGMNEMLGDVFGTKVAHDALAHTDEDLEKRANLEYFNKLCDAEGIKLAELNDEQVTRLWHAAMEKQAEEAGSTPAEKAPPEKKDDSTDKEASEKRAAANREWLEKKAAAAKVAEAETMGKIMAHAYVAELRKIAEAMEGEGKAPPFGGKDEKKEEKDEEGKEKESSAQRAERLIAALADKEKQASPTSSTTSNLDEVAAWHAIDMLKKAGVNEELAFKRVDAAYTLGLKESTKIASAQSEAAAVHVRALEICEAAGFQVDWTKA